ncbi:NOX5 [Cordylochernes scorpioides]|uniref:NOX5 n=1 Tax=Cordylochernes scorpioides TaxID=51811 RepID=A0ABY6LGV2_9ARAC|nr:NOX5 [Cordylochernes scorpioides]
MELINHVFKNNKNQNNSPLQVTSECLHRLEDRFKQMVGDSPSQEISLDQFKLIINSKNETFAERMFKVFDTNNSGTVSLSEFMTSMWNFTRLESREKLKYLFDIYDLDGDGSIDHEELQRVLRACMEENGLRFSQSELDELADLLFEDAKAQDGGCVTFDSFEKQLRRQPGLVENICASLDRWLLPDFCQNNPPRWRPHWPHKLTRGYVLNNKSSCAFFAALVALHAVLLGVGAWRYRGANGWVQMARACGMCLNMDSALILILVLRRSISWLRSLGLAAVLPLDHHVYYHKLVGWTIGLLSLGHTVAHVANVVQGVRSTPREESEQVRLVFEKLFSSRAMVTGWVLLVVLVVMTLCSLPCVRRSGRFEVFYYSHLLFLLYWAVLLAHGPMFWAWLLVPGLVFLAESLLRLLRHLRASTYVERGVLLPSGVTHLVIRRPPDFSFSAGDYVYVNIPTVASYEWHPFTLSSAPEQQGELWLHIRAAGGWTKKLHSYFEKQEKRAVTAPSARTLRQTLRSWSVPGTRMPLAAPPNPAVPEDEEGSMPLSPITPRQLEAGEGRPRPRKVLPKRLESIRVSQRQATRSLSGGTVTVLLPTLAEEDSEPPPESSCTPSLDELRQRSEDVVLSRNPLKIYLDGPYGSPSSAMFRAEHAVLIATGIGVTPYASVLKSLVHRYKEARQSCPQCGHSWAVSPPSVFSLKKVDFFWLNRHPTAFEWFVGLLGQLEAEQAVLPNNERFLDVHMFVTAARGRGDVRALGLQLALDLLHRREQRCLITGLKTRMQPGRPDWKQVFQDLANQNKGKVTVFFCGPPNLAKTLHSMCNEFGFKFRKENF